MIVLDASAAIDWLLQTPAGQRIEHRVYSHNETLHTPHLLDLEVTQVLRRLLHSLNALILDHFCEAQPRRAALHRM